MSMIALVSRKIIGDYIKSRGIRFHGILPLTPFRHSVICKRSLATIAQPIERNAERSTTAISVKMHY